MTLITLFEGC